MPGKLLEELNALHDAGEFASVAKRIRAIDENARDYDLSSLLGRALNNMNRYADALAVLETLAAKGEDDPVWHWRIGYSLYFLDQPGRAAAHFRQAIALGSNDAGTREMLAICMEDIPRQEMMEKFKASQPRRDPARAPFEGFNLDAFWDDGEYALEEYVSEPPTDELIASLEAELGYRLPFSYVWLMKRHNGGIPHNGCFPTGVATSWSDDHIAITGIMGIGREKDNSLGGGFGSRFWIEEWGYPDIGVAICDCPSAGHDMIFLDYRFCGQKGEPAVVHIDQEDDYRITFLAHDFESFIRGLEHEDLYDGSEEDRAHDLEMVQSAAFSPLLADLCARSDAALDMEGIIRRIAQAIVEEKGHFSLHADERSWLLYDILFWLYTHAYPDTAEADYLEAYPQMIALAGPLTTGGYAPAFVTDWLKARKKEKAIVTGNGRVTFSPGAQEKLVTVLKSGM